VQQGLELLSHLDKDDLDWVFDIGEEQQVIANTVIIQEGVQPDSIFFVLEGLLAVTIQSIEGQQLATLGPGEIVGEISFLQRVPASASVTAIENTLLLAISQTKLSSKMSEVPQFAANFYRALALESANRLSRSTRNVGRLYTEKSQAISVTNDAWESISEDFGGFKELIHRADLEAIKQDGTMPDAFKEQITEGFKGFVFKLNALIGDDAPGNSYFKAELGRRVQREFLPYLLLTRISERMYSKPRGYAGDFFTIEMMYRGLGDGGHRLGDVLDECFLKQPACRAVQNRRGLLAEEISTLIAEGNKEVTHVTSMACGPAAELFDVFEGLDDKSKLKATLIDIDLQALAFVGDKRDKLKLTRQMEMINGNLVYLATGRQKVFIKEQDLVYSIGLIDYFNDKFVLMLLNYVHDLLKPGGRVILGNFHPKNTSKALMDHVLNWELIHRSEEDMNRLFSASKFGKDCDRIRYEDEGVNLFAVCTKS